MSQEISQLQEDIDLRIRSKIADLKGTLFSLQLHNESLEIDVARSGANGTFQHLLDVQSSGQMIERICEEILTLLAVMKQIRVQGTSATYSISSLQSRS